ncbi:hypothetical protein CC1G_10494 [Coprinopsis cinerea okayama7|uniref:G protein-coupled receptor n=1 Tax=Coprinopsis cinerea (strain Okayama-7 / 130 / ATCC MYA-4618 / FGSC 9003) TaxID=240176 RepID=A8NL60_COPC7|nr:hypothetical protein CC1G_10494 [Coprinopsis cinerea okayama7\|eukprot:XP_001834620.2 hypothetical protein CC1G_10494 [Coprinopsis cinerea okayama7\
MSMYDPQEWERYLNIVAGGIYSSVVFAMTVTGLQIFMSFYGLYLFLESPKEARKGRLPYVLVSFAILGCSLISSTMDASTTFKLLYQHPSAEPRSLLQILGEIEHGPVRITSGVFFALMILAGDAVLVRYLPLHPRTLSLPNPILTPNSPPHAATELYRTIVRIKLSINPSAPMHDFAHIVNAVYLVFTVSCNVLTTVLIAYRLLRAHRQLSAALPNRDMRVYKSIVGILVQSAAPLAVSGLAYAVTEVILVALRNIGPEHLPLYNRVLIASWVLGRLYDASAALAPQMIIFLVTSGRSGTKREEITAPASRSHAFSQPLRFNNGPAQDSFMTSNVMSSNGDGYGSSEKKSEGSDVEIGKEKTNHDSGLSEALKDV